MIIRQYQRYLFINSNSFLNPRIIEKNRQHELGFAYVVKIAKKPLATLSKILLPTIHSLVSSHRSRK
jgi:hypothetical protein